jgi:predicted ATP-binding protein involved in virulence
MKIRRIKYNNHQVLGNLELDFVNPATGLAFDTIVLIGENGTGKTTILTTISDYLNCISLRPFSYIEYNADGHQYRIEPIQNGNLCFHTRWEIGSDLQETIRRDTGNDPNTMYSDKKDLRSYASVFSKARADYQVNKIGSISTKTLDSDMRERDENDNYTSLKQLIVDIDNQDSKDYKNQNRIGQVSWGAFYPTSRMHRFTHAFDSFFGGKVQFDRIDTVNQDNLILFKKNGQDVPIDSLSTGEKQIVYRGAYLLKNNGKMDEGAVFIDEPELSMHPSWQLKILDYFQNLYRTPAGQMKAQIFMASHSEYLVESALKQSGQTLVVVLKEQGGVVSAEPVTMPLLLPTVIASEVNYAAFGIPSKDYHIALYGHIQAKYNKPRIVDCDRFIESCVPYYDAVRHQKITRNPTGTQYNTVPTKVRNHIDHPNSAPAYTAEEMEDSIKLMREILVNVP